MFVVSWFGLLRSSHSHLCLVPCEHELTAHPRGVPKRADLGKYGHCVLSSRAVCVVHFCAFPAACDNVTVFLASAFWLISNAMSNCFHSCHSYRASCHHYHFYPWGNWIIWCFLIVISTLSTVLFQLCGFQVFPLWWVVVFFSFS